MSLDKEKLLLYGITDRKCLGGRSLYEQTEDALKGGVSLLQLREKNISREEFVKEAEQIKELCDRYDVPLIINDDVETALQIGAAGVHVGQKDMEACQARKKLGENKILGVTARTLEQALQAQKDGADYLGVGAVFHTDSKKDAVDLDWNVLREICASVDIPVVAIGGINKDNVLRLCGTGIDGVAVISGIFGQEDVENTARIMRQKVNEIVEKRGR